jgi:hypothetical protein
MTTTQTKNSLVSFLHSPIILGSPSFMFLDERNSADDNFEGNEQTENDEKTIDLNEGKDYKVIGTYTPNEWVQRFDSFKQVYTFVYRIYSSSSIRLLLFFIHISEKIASSNG